MRASSFWNGFASAIRMTAVGTGAVLYMVSFLDYGWSTSILGYGWDTGGNLLIAAFALIFLSSIPTSTRDRRFFLKHWGFGLTRLRSQFPFQFFPAREEKWLNTLAWCFMAALIMHFAWFAARSDGPHQEIADLRLMSLLVAVSGTLNVLSWDYPPTKKPQKLGS